MPNVMEEGSTRHVQVLRARDATLITKSEGGRMARCFLIVDRVQKLKKLFTRCSRYFSCISWMFSLSRLRREMILIDCESIPCCMVTKQQFLRHPPSVLLPLTRLQLLPDLEVRTSGESVNGCAIWPFEWPVLAYLAMHRWDCIFANCSGTHPGFFGSFLLAHLNPSYKADPGAQQD